MQDTRYVYIVTRKDLPSPIKSVQSSHAAIAATHAFGDPSRTHPHLVVCEVEDEPTLNKEFNRLKEAGVPVCGWYEDDLENQLTAIATAPLAGPIRRFLRGFKLLR